MTRKITITEKLREVVGELQKQTDLLSLEPESDQVNGIVEKILGTKERLVDSLFQLDIVYKSLDDINEGIRVYMAVKELDRDGD